MITIKCLTGQITFIYNIDVVKSVRFLPMLLHAMMVAIPAT